MSEVQQSITIPATELVREFLTENGKEVIKRMFVGFESAQVVRKFDGVTDELVFAVQDITESLIREWSSTMSTTDDAISITDVRLNVAQMKVELKFVLKAEVVRAYKAYLKGAGLVSDDLSLIDYLLMDVMPKLQEELEDGIWQGEEDTSGTGNRLLIQRINGYRTIAAAAAVAGKATVVATGSIDNTNAVTKVQQFYKGAHKTMRKNGFHIFCSYATFEAYQEHLLTLHGNADIQIQEVKAMGYTLEGIPLRLGKKKTMLIPLPGIGDDDALIGTRAEFLAYGFDYESEWTEWDVQKHGWEVWCLNAFPVGVQILMQREGFLLINDQL